MFWERPVSRADGFCVKSTLLQIPSHLQILSVIGYHLQQEPVNTNGNPRRESWKVNITLMQHVTEEELQEKEAQHEALEAALKDYGEC